MDTLRTIRLCKGAGQPGKEACWMSAGAAWIRGLWVGDSDECVDEPIRYLCIEINDSLSDEARNELIAGDADLFFAPFGTAGDNEASERRMWMLVDAAVRQFAPHDMRSRGMSVCADWLERLPPVTAETVEQALVDTEAVFVGAAGLGSKAAMHARATILAAARHVDAKRRNCPLDAEAEAYFASTDAAIAASSAPRFGDPDAFGCTVLIPLLRRMIEAGPHAPVERVPCGGETKFRELIGA